MAAFQDYIEQNKFLLMGGAMGTELQRRGFETKLPLWSAGANLDVPDLVTQIFTDYLAAGAQTCVTNTFRTTPRTYEKLGKPELARESLRAAVRCARDARARFPDRQDIFIAGSFATLEDCYEPDLVPDEPALTREHEEQAQWLAEEGVDFLLPETINSLREAIVMGRAASNTGLPFIISFVVRDNGDLFDGTPLKEAIEKTDFKGRAGVSINCRPIDTLNKALPVLCEHYSGFKGIYANGIGHPHKDLGWVFEENADSLEKYSAAAVSWHDAGCGMIGGCCGTTPAYIKALADAFSKDIAKRSVA
jgi:S-methylmethionine-dependent homocysteine/selenocysteine methylase